MVSYFVTIILWSIYRLLLRQTYITCSPRSYFKLWATRTAEVSLLHPPLWCSTVRSWSPLTATTQLTSLIVKAKFKPSAPAHKGQYRQGPIYLQGMLKLRETPKSLFYFWPGATDCHTHHHSPCSSSSSMDSGRSKIQLKPTSTHVFVLLSLWTLKIPYVVLHRNCRWSQSTKNKWQNQSWGFLPHKLD